MKQSLLIIVFALSAITASAQQKPAAAVTPNGGDHLMYIGTYAGTIQIFDDLRGPPLPLLRDGFEPRLNARRDQTGRDTLAGHVSKGQRISVT